MAKGHGHSHGGSSHSHSHSHSHGHGHSHDGGGEDAKFCGCCHLSNRMRLTCMLVMTFFFFLVELITGQITKSIALTTDSFHMLSDSLALVIGLVSVILSGRKSTKNTFGWVRAEILGALVNSVFLVSLCLGIVVEAVERLIEQKEIHNPNLLLIVGFIGLTINLIGLFIFGHAHSHNLPAIPSDSDSEDDHSDESDLEECCNKDKQKKTTTRANSSENHETEAMIVKTESPNAAASGTSNETKIENNSSEKKKKRHGDSTHSHSHSHSHGSPGSNHGHSHGKAKKPSKPSKTRCHILSDEANMNMRAVFLHVLADALGSVIVIISALLNIYRTPLHIPDKIIALIDPLLCIALVILILMSTLPLLKESALILLQTVPKEIKINKLKQDIVQKINGIVAVHELHVWKLSGNKIIATAHVTCHNSVEYMQIATELKEFFHKKGIHSTTIQPEFTDIVNPNDVTATNNCILECKTNTCNQNTCCEIQKPPTAAATQQQQTQNVQIEMTKTSHDGD